MKSRLNITVDDMLTKKAKRYASRHNTSISQLVEEYFKTLTRPSRDKTIIQLVEQLPKPRLNVDIDLKAAYYEDQKSKHGF